jgi:hypothetical protein
MMTKNINRITVKVFLLISAFLITTITFAGENRLESLKAEFVQKITSGKDGFEIIDEKEDKKDFLKKSLPDFYMPGDEKLKYKEIFIRNKKETGHYHLGLISLEYKDKTKAKEFYNAVHAKKTKY